MRLFGISTDGKLTPYAERDFKVGNMEEQLERWLEANPDCILEDEDVLLIGRQVTTNLGSVIDLLGIDRAGNLVVIELKRDRTPRDTLAQILEYASFVDDLSLEQLEALWREYADEEERTLPEVHREYFELGEDEAVSFNKDARLVIVGQQITREIRQTSTYLQKRGLNISCLEFKYFTTLSGEQMMLTDFVVGKETASVSRVSTTSKAAMTLDTFLASADDFGREFFSMLFDFAEENDLFVHWRPKSVSLNVRLGGTHVSFLEGYPSVIQGGQGVYSVSYSILGKVANGENVAREFNESLGRLGMFSPTGRNMKWAIDRRLTEDEEARFLETLRMVIRRIRENGLKTNNE